MTASCTCGRQWAGLAQAHCTVCHEHFSTVANFDRHRPRGVCRNPGSIRNEAGGAVLKASPGPFGCTWVRSDGSGHPGKAAKARKADAA